MPPSKADLPSRKISGRAGAEIVPAIALQGFWRIDETTGWTVHRAYRIAFIGRLEPHPKPAKPAAYW